jgi:ABC-type transport system substrate-binding protein
MRKSVKILAALLSAALLLTGCQGGGDKPTSTTDSGTDKTETIGTFITAVQGDPSSFNPDMKSDDYLWPMAQNLFNRLYKLAPGDVPIPDLATSYEWSDDNMTLTFHLRDGVKWHDGEPLTSKDVKWTYDTIIENKWAKSDTFVNVDTIEAPDDLTVVFNMKNPDAGLVPLLAWYATFILPEHIWNDPAYPDFAKNPAMQKPIGSGPFKFVEYKSGQSVTLERNEDFFGGAPEIERLIYQIMPDLNTTLEAFKNGEIDYITSLPTANLHDFDNDPNYEVFSS